MAMTHDLPTQIFGHMQALFDDFVGGARSGVAQRGWIEIAVGVSVAVYCHSNARFRHAYARPTSSSTMNTAISAAATTGNLSYTSAHGKR